MQYNEPLYAGFDRAAARFPDKASLIYLGTTFTYNRLSALVNGFASGLKSMGIQPGDRLVLYIPNCPQFIISYLGAQRAGAVPVPVSPIYTPHEMRYLIDDSDAKAIVCMNTNFGYVREIFHATCLQQIIVTNYVELLPLQKRFVGFLFDKVPKGTVDKGKEVYSFEQVIKTGGVQSQPVPIDASQDFCYILYTGGTTGFPKGCPSTHRGMVSFVEEIRAMGEGFLDDGKEMFVMVNPLFHQMALGMIFGMVLARGNTAVLMPIPQVDAILDAIQRYRSTLFLGAPTLYRMILENDRFPLYDLSSLKYCWSGGDVLPLEVFNRWKELVRVPIRQVFGATEVGFVAMDPLDKDPVPGSVGLPLPSREVRIVDATTFKDVAPNNPGELWVTSEHIYTSYWKKPEETAASYVEQEGKTWYRMKDMARRDVNGLLYYVDRGADIIKYKGYRISCSEIESILQDHPAVVGACVVGVPDGKVGERIKGIVVLKEDARGVSGTDLIRWCRDRLAPYKIPKYIEFRDMLPKSKVGKLLRRELRDEERRRIEKGEKQIRI